MFLFPLYLKDIPFVIFSVRRKYNRIMLKEKKRDDGSSSSSSSSNSTLFAKYRQIHNRYMKN